MAPYRKRRREDEQYARSGVGGSGGGDSGGGSPQRSILKQQRRSLAIAFGGGREIEPPDYATAVRFASKAVKYEMTSGCGGGDGSSDSDSVDSFLSPRRTASSTPKASASASSKPFVNLKGSGGGGGGGDRDDILPDGGGGGGNKKRSRLDSLSTIFISPEAFKQPESQTILRRLSRDLNPNETTFVFTGGTMEAGGSAGSKLPAAASTTASAAASAAASSGGSSFRSRKTGAFAAAPVSPDIFEKNQATFSNSPAQFDKSKETFAKGEFDKRNETFAKGEFDKSR